MTTSLSAFLLQCVIIAVAIGFDVFFATIANFKRRLTLGNWVLPITCTHTLFPAFGYYAVWYLGEQLPLLQLPLGIAGFVLVALFLYEEIYEKIGNEPVVAITEVITNYLPIPRHLAATYVLVLGVSWDALLSGPAIESIVSAASWSTTLIAWSFPVVGLFVFVITLFSFHGASTLRARHYHNVTKLAQVHFWSDLIGLSIIGGFGVLSLWEGAQAWLGNGSLLYSTLISGSIIGLVFFVHKQSLMRTECTEAHEALDE